MNTINPSHCCRACIWWDQMRERGDGTKVLATFKEGETRTVEVGRCCFDHNFVSTREDDWCGQFGPRIPI